MSCSGHTIGWAASIVHREHFSPQHVAKSRLSTEKKGYFWWLLFLLCLLFGVCFGVWKITVDMARSCFEPVLSRDCYSLYSAYYNFSANFKDFQMISENITWHLWFKTTSPYLSHSKKAFGKLTGHEHLDIQVSLQLHLLHFSVHIHAISCSYLLYILSYRHIFHVFPTKIKIYKKN